MAASQKLSVVSCPYAVAQATCSVTIEPYSMSAALAFTAKHGCQLPSVQYHMSLLCQHSVACMVGSVWKPVTAHLEYSMNFSVTDWTSHESLNFY